jgi:hypothetical protein
VVSRGSGRPPALEPSGGPPRDRRSCRRLGSVGCGARARARRSARRRSGPGRRAQPHKRGGGIGAYGRDRGTDLEGRWRVTRRRGSGLSGGEPGLSSPRPGRTHTRLIPTQSSWIPISVRVPSQLDVSRHFHTLIVADPRRKTPGPPLDDCQDDDNRVDRQAPLTAGRGRGDELEDAKLHIHRFRETGSRRQRSSCRGLSHFGGKATRSSTGQTVAPSQVHSGGGIWTDIRDRLPLCRDPCLWLNSNSVRVRLAGRNRTLRKPSHSRRAAGSSVRRSRGVNEFGSTSPDR